mgnify:CR=1 FL=1
MSIGRFVVVVASVSVVALPMPLGSAESTHEGPTGLLALGRRPAGPTPHEQRLDEIARGRNKTFHVWTCSQGVVKFGADPQRAQGGSGNTCDPVAGLEADGRLTLTTVVALEAIAPVTAASSGSTPSGAWSSSTPPSSR